MSKSVIAELTKLKEASANELRKRWRELFDTEPPAYNRRFLESRLAYRIQELAHGGLKRDTLDRLRALADEQAGQTQSGRRRASAANRPIAGTKLVREWQGVEHRVTVLADGFEYLGQPYKSLSSIAREIAGTRWNGWVFFGLKNQKSKP